ncbi:MAG: NTP transferase domain-containing protein [Planctomycetota bacterium]|jgi:bifunctional N-acetylglucosamine-1-phosphate-uridyltransferase/glucosamine-1-phosphate-acetyltransferase GlmU-like protein
MILSNDIPQQTIVVILAGGKGIRIGATKLPKVCLKINGVPAINGVIGAFKRHRFSKFLIVVGHGAEHVLDIVNREHPGAIFAYQSPQLGTGHAARIAAEALQSAGHKGNVLLTMADKYIEDAAIEALVDGFAKQEADLALLAIPRTAAIARSAGWIITDRTGQAIDIIEKVDLARLMIADELNRRIAKDGQITGDEILAVLDKHIPDPNKQAVSIGELLTFAKNGRKVDEQRLRKVLQSRQYKLLIDSQRYSAHQLEKACKTVNPSLYLVKTEAFYWGVARINKDNAQKEYYLTDIVKHLAGYKDTGGKPKFRTRVVPVSDSRWIQGFNSMDELLAIRDYIRYKKPVE